MKGGLDMGENIRSRELDLALFQLNTAIHEKLGDDYLNLSYTFDRMDTIEVIETMLKSVKRAYRGYVMEQLFEAGARDVHYTPVFMKKNRPAWQLNVICKEEDIERLEQIIFQETTTIGIRRVEMERSILKREEKTVSTAFGQAEVKICEARGVSRVYPEYESVAKLAKESQVPFSKVYQIVQKSCSES